jgi:hypothetical protein
MKVLKENFNVREMIVISEKESESERKLNGDRGVDREKVILE